MPIHTDKFIEEMKQLLNQEKIELDQELKSEAHNQDGDEVANFPDYGRHDEDNATEIADYTAQSAIVESKEARVKEIEAALKRVEAGIYGVTKNGDKIPEKRLRANPAATTTVK